MGVIKIDKIRLVIQQTEQLGDAVRLQDGGWPTVATTKEQLEEEDLAKNFLCFSLTKYQI